jgi:hypothetical protein
LPRKITEGCKGNKVSLKWILYSLVIIDAMKILSVLAGLFLVATVTACALPLPPANPGSRQSVPTAAQEVVMPTLLIFPTPIPELTTATPTRTPASTETPASAGIPTGQPTLLASTVTPTEAPRLAAEKWQQWPVIPTITNRARDSYLRGLDMGANPHAFAKVGDCQCVNVAFFGIYDQPKLYRLPKGFEALQETIDWFAGSFNRDSAAVRGGFNVASVFVPLQADPQLCRAGETPLACEFRNMRPSIVLISMETGFEGRTAAVYEKYMRQIIEYALTQGSLPILATKADDFEGDQSINLTTARLAVEYDLPLWNFWRAVQDLPNHGMDAERNDRFHISVEAWNVRSFTGLQVLDAMWRAVRTP